MLKKSHLMLKNWTSNFKHKKKKLEYLIRIKLSRKRIYPSNSIKYFGVKIDDNLKRKDYFMILLQNWTELMHSYLKSGIMLILIP